MAYLTPPSAPSTRLFTLNVNQTNTDLGSIIVPEKILLLRVIPYGASVNMGALAALLGLYDAAAGGGNVLVTPAALIGLTTALKAPLMTILYTDVITSRLLVPRVTTAAGAPATINLAIQYLDLT